MGNIVEDDDYFGPRAGDRTWLWDDTAAQWKAGEVRIVYMFVRPLGTDVDACCVVSPFSLPFPSPLLSPQILEFRKDAEVRLDDGGDVKVVPPSRMQLELPLRDVVEVLSGSTFVLAEVRLLLRGVNRLCPVFW